MVDHAKEQYMYDDFLKYCIGSVAGFILYETSSSVKLRYVVVYRLISRILARGIFSSYIKNL